MGLTLAHLDSGYWLARWSKYQFIQWPVGRVPTMEDAFGDVSTIMLEEAEEAAQKKEDEMRERISR